MKETYTRQEVLNMTNNYASQIARLRKQLDDNAKKFTQLLYESIDLPWTKIDEDNEESISCS